MTSLSITEYAKSMVDAITCLKNAGHTTCGLMLVYSAIDQMAWLSTPDKDVNGKHFKRWVDKYLIANNPLGCSSDDLWGARCGLLHTGTAESRVFRDGEAKNKIYYNFGPCLVTENKSADVLFISFESLVLAFFAGVLFFEEEIKHNPQMLQIANEKMKLILVPSPL